MSARHRHILLARERAGHARDFVLGAARFQALEDFGGEQRLDRNEGKAKRASEIAEAEREAGPVLEGERAGLAGAVDAVDRPEPVERAAADDQAFHQACADQEIGVETGHALGNRQVALVLPDQFVGDRDHVAGDGKAAERDMRAVRDASDHLGRCLDFTSHDRSLTPGIGGRPRF